MANNPALNKFRSTVMAPSRPASPGQRPASSGPGQAPPVGQLEQMYNQPAYGGPTYPPTGGVPGYGGGGSGGAPSRYMTLDAVVVRFSAMLAVLFTAGALAWALTPRSNATPILLIGVMGGLALGLYISFTMKANAVTSLVYAGFEGLALGSVSRLFNAHYAGIVVQALTGTVMVAGGVLVAYKVGAIRVTPKFWRVTIAATIGVFGLMVVNMIAYLFHPGGLGLRDGGALAIVFSLLCIGVAAMKLVLDFDVIEQGIKHGADEKLAWYAAFGLMVTLVWLYLEILRLLGYLRN